MPMMSISPSPDCAHENTGTALYRHDQQICDFDSPPICSAARDSRTVRDHRRLHSMAETTTRHDAWQAGDSYDLYMGRWSRQVAPRFLDWLGAPSGGDWLDVGCGTGALSAAILQRCAPATLLAIDPSEGFIARARTNVPDTRATFRVGDAQAVPADDASKDAIVSALVLNFVPDRAKALAEMKRVARPGAVIGFYVWDYPGGGIALMRHFWNAASALDPKAQDLTEDKRFPFCTQQGVADLARKAGLAAVECVPIEVPTVFKDFDDYWRPFTLGAGPAPGYCTSLPPDARERLRKKLDEDLPRAADGSIPLTARAWAVKASAN
jgi:ubiquinone/menaquinone biosynthesis C-methylase UbiE